MNISDEAKEIFIKCLSENNKYGIIMKYLKDSDDIDVNWCDKDAFSEYTLINDIPFVFLDGAFEKTFNWSIVEENSKLTIKKRAECCIDHCCEYSYNKVSCNAKEED